MSNIRGLEILYAIISDKIQSKADCLVAGFHCLMIKDGDMCVGMGDEWPESVTENDLSELLPEGWNSNQEVYSLSDEKASGASLNINNHVSDDYKTFKTAFKNMKEVEKKFINEVINEVKLKKGEDKEKAGPSEQKKTESETSLEFDREPFLDYRIQPLTSNLREDRNYPRGLPIGEDDLHPFGGGRSGMLFDPGNYGFPSRPSLPQFGVGGPRGLPRGAVPPGARFDPIRPPMPGRGPFSGHDPDPDHLPPPGFDDSFM